jgi:hypothetical protein
MSWRSPACPYTRECRLTLVVKGDVQKKKSASWDADFVMILSCRRYVLPSHATRQEAFQLAGTDGVLQLADGFGFHLADALAGDLEDAPIRSLSISCVALSRGLSAFSSSIKLPTQVYAGV